MSFYSPDELQKLGFLFIGQNVKISTKASFYGAERISIGSNSRIDDFCVLSTGEGGIYIGRNVHVSVMCTLIGKGRIELHDFSGISGRVSIYSSNDDYSGEYMTNPTVPEAFTNVDHRDVVLKKHVLIGAGSIVLPGVTISEGTVIGALSLVTKSLKSFGIYIGSPSLKRLKPRSQRLLELEKLYLESEQND